MFDSQSRYASIEVVSQVQPDGSVLAYIKRRFIPQPTGSVMGQVLTEQGDRLDTITSRTLGDPLQFWRVCDGNLELNPFDLVEATGRTIIFRMPGT